MEDHAGELMMLELEAREAWDRRDYSRARQIAEEAMKNALKRGDDTSWWSMTFLRAECLREEGDVKGSETAIRPLANHPLTITSPQLRARVSTFHAVALRGLGQLAKAVSEATLAVQMATLSDANTGRLIEAKHGLIAALAENGEVEAAWAECLQLDILLDSDVDEQTAGKCHWAMGNVAFMRSDITEGTRYHQLAAEQLSPTNDLELWAWFNRGSATQRLAAGVVEPETLQCIERAEMGTSIVGGSERHTLELKLNRAHWLVLTGDFGDAVGRLKNVCAHSSILPIHILGEAHLLLGKALQGLQEQEEATRNLLTSEELFREAGAADRATYVRTLIDAE